MQNKDELKKVDEEWIGVGTERSGRTFVTEEELSFLEQEKVRTAVKYPRPISPPRKQIEDLDENFDDEQAFSDQYLASKGIDYSQKPDDKAVQTTTTADEMDPSMLAEMAKWNFIKSENDPTTMSMVEFNDMATTIRLKELEECESRADIHTGEYTISGRLKEGQMRKLLAMQRNGVNIDAIVENNGLNKEDLKPLFEYTISPLYHRDSEDDIFTAS